MSAIHWKLLKMNGHSYFVWSMMSKWLDTLSYFPTTTMFYAGNGSEWNNVSPVRVDSYWQRRQNDFGQKSIDIPKTLTTYYTQHNIRAPKLISQGRELYSEPKGKPYSYRSIFVFLELRQLSKQNYKTCRCCLL